MTAEEFIESYSWKRAEEMQAEMQSYGSRRPSKWTFIEKYGDSVVKNTIYFWDCPFKLKSSGMVTWLRAMVLWNEATYALQGFLPLELIKIG